MRVYVCNAAHCLVYLCCCIWPKGNLVKEGWISLASVFVRTCVCTYVTLRTTGFTCAFISGLRLIWWRNSALISKACACVCVYVCICLQPHTYVSVLRLMWSLRSGSMSMVCVCVYVYIYIWCTCVCTFGCHKLKKSCEYHELNMS